MLLHIVARGKIGRSPEGELVDRYLKRIAWPTRLTELPEAGGREPPVGGQTRRVLLDEKGEVLGSAAFAERLGRWRDDGVRETRFLLGAAEAGFFPGAILFLSLWVPARHRAKVLAVFYVAQPLTTVIGGESLFRVAISPQEHTGLSVECEVQVDRITSVRRHRIVKVIGHASATRMEQVDQALRRWLNL